MEKNNFNLIVEQLDEDFKKHQQYFDYEKAKTGMFRVQETNKWMEQASQRPIPKRLFGDFWFESELSILFADTNVGKSILAVQIGNAISSGTSTCKLNCESPPQKVIYFDFELTDKQFQARYSDNYQDNYQFNRNFLRAEIDIDGDIPNRFKNMEEYLNFSIEEVIKQTEAKIIIIDNITYLKHETENAKNALPLMKELKSLKNKYGLSILILAHTPKRDLSKPLSRNDISGSKMLVNFCDSAFAIGESSTDTVVRYIKQIKVRNTEADYTSDNVYVCEIAKEHNFLKFHHTGYANELEHLKIETSSDKDELEESVIDLKKNNPDYSNRKIADVLGTNHKRVGRILKKYQNNGTF